MPSLLVECAPGTRLNGSTLYIIVRLSQPEAAVVARAAVDNASITTPIRCIAAQSPNRLAPWAQLPNPIRRGRATKATAVLPVYCPGHSSERTAGEELEDSTNTCRRSQSAPDPQAQLSTRPPATRDVASSPWDPPKVAGPFGQGSIVDQSRSRNALVHGHGLLTGRGPGQSSPSSPSRGQPLATTQPVPGVTQSSPRTRARRSCNLLPNPVGGKS